MFAPRAACVAAALPLAALMVLRSSGPAFGDPPPAGAEVVNQANVLYTDADGVAREALTNEVVLFVQQVYSATLQGDGARGVVPGASARFTHTLTNTGNGADIYCVSAEQLSSDGGEFELIEVFQDVNGDGDPSGDPVVWSSAGAPAPGQIELAASQTLDLIMVAQTDAGTANGTSLAVDLRVSSFSGTGACGGGVVADIGANADSADGTNRNVATVTLGAVLELAKASTYRQGALADLSDDQIDYVITLTNTGAAPASDVTVTDVLAAELDFASFGSHDGTFSAGPSMSNDVITAGLATLGPGDSAVIRFTADVVDALGASGEGLTIENTASVSGNLDGAPGLEAPVASNTTRDTASAFYQVALSDTGSGGLNGVNDGGDDDALNGTQFVDTAAPGDTVFFNLDVTNTGNVVDTYTLETGSASGWLSGAAFRYLYSDRATPLLDTNGDGLADTGPLAPGETMRFVVAAVLPSTAPPAPHGAAVTVTSTANLPTGTSRASASAGLAIGSAGSSGVDIANASGVPGFNDDGAVNAHPPTSVATQKTAPPGGSVVFDLFIANEGEGGDVFQLSAHPTLAADTAFPAGWVVRFLDDTGAEISSTPRLAPGDVFDFTAQVTAPTSALDAAVQDVFLTARSLETGVSDTKRDSVAINRAPAITLTPDGSGTISACGITEYTHVLRNTGTTSEDVRVRIDSQTRLNAELRYAAAINGGEPGGYVDAGLAVAGDDVAILSQSGWRVDALVDAGAFGPAIRLAPGEEARIRARVSAPCDTPPATVDVLTLSAVSSDGDASATAQNRTEVGSARLEVTKFGALDAGCDGAPDTGFLDAQVRAEPGQCVVWQITLENAGAETVCDVRARDAAPAFTQLVGLPGIVEEPAPGTGACAVLDRDFACSLGNALDPNGNGAPQAFCLAAGQIARVNFSVQVD
ncbi:MAG: hypothetical protein AAGH87_09095 [Pseudomonadota bacterium]